MLDVIDVEEAVVLVVLGVVEQRHAAVLEVLVDGASVSGVAVRFGVSRQTVQRWLRRYAVSGLAGLVDQSSTPRSCPHQMPPEIEAQVVALRRAHPGWGPRTIGHQLGRDGVVAHVPIAVLDHLDDHVVREDGQDLGRADGASSHLGWGVPAEP